MRRLWLRLLLARLRARHGVWVTVRACRREGVTVYWVAHVDPAVGGTRRVCTFSGTHRAAARELPRLVPESMTRQAHC